MNKPSSGHQPKIIALEFNELSPSLLLRWMNDGLLPNFKKFYEQSVSFTGLADVEDPVFLEPWIQWYSLHTGLNYEQHKVFHLTDGPVAGHADIWSMLAGEGFRVASFGSMNNRRSDEHSVFVPDPWCRTELCVPNELQIYHDVISSLVHENGSGGKGHIRYVDFLKFVQLYIKKGWNFFTIRKFIAQGLREFRRGSGERWMRVPLLDRLQFDLFRHYWINTAPNFTTFFLNSTAHYQHAYWNLAFPDEFGASNKDNSRDSRSVAILYGYQMMDRLLEDFFKLEEIHGAQLILLSGLSQQADPHAKMVYYRPKDIFVILSLLGISAESCLPVMAQQFSLKLGNKTSAEHALRKIENLRVEGVGQLFDVSVDDQGSVFFGSGIHSRVGDDALIIGFPDGQSRKFTMFMRDLGHSKTGVHHPSSVIWFKTGRQAAVPNPVSILDVVPTLIDIFGGDVEKAKKDLALGGKSLRTLIYPEIPLNSDILKKELLEVNS